MSQPWVIRPARDEDAARLSVLAERTFRDTFAATNTADDMELYCAGAYSPEIQAAEIRDPNKTTLLVEQDDQLVAYAQLDRSTPPPSVTARRPIELKRFYLQQTIHGSGVASDLMRAVIEGAGGLGADVMWLGVWERNPRAIRFYEKSGFRTVGDHVFQMGSDPQRDLIMVTALGDPIESVPQVP